RRTGTTPCGRSVANSRDAVAIGAVIPGASDAARRIVPEDALTLGAGAPRALAARAAVVGAADAARLVEATATRSRDARASGAIAAGQAVVAPTRADPRSARSAGTARGRAAIALVVLAPDARTSDANAISVHGIGAVEIRGASLAFERVKEEEWSKGDA